MFGTKLTEIYGTYGDFYIDGENQVKARFVLTKIKPGSDGTWENLLASQLKPWREVFAVDTLTFDELIQRDLDDSRVAHELIPYLIKDRSSNAKFFPPILAVMAPKQSTGISKTYPELKTIDNKIVFGDFASFEPVEWDVGGKKVISPLGKLSFNPQKTAFVIVDGQHRAMAILALHKQLNNDWNGSPYHHFYDHIKVTHDDLRHIELPVCIVYFPELTANSKHVVDNGINLNNLCREIFLAVNKNAKHISTFREVILDDNDFSAITLRRLLSKLKDRNNECTAKIHSIAYGDSSTKTDKEVIHSIFEYSSAICIHKMCSALLFGHLETTKLGINPSDCTDGKYTRNPNRPMTYFLGLDFIENIQLIRKDKAHTYNFENRKKIVEGFVNLVEPMVLNFFDSLYPFMTQNEELDLLKHKLSDPSIRSRPEVAKAYNLIFEGSGARDTFDDHFERIAESLKEGDTKSPEMERIHSFNQSVNRAKTEIEVDFKRNRALRLFNLEKTNSLTEEEFERIVSWSNSIFSTISTQAFQIGFVMSLQSIIDKCFVQIDYEKRCKINEEISNLFINVINLMLKPKSKARSINSVEKNAIVGFFSTSASGFRSLLRLSVTELNEKQWVFFRYSIIDAVFSKLSTDNTGVLSEFTKKSLLNNVNQIVNFIFDSREYYIGRAVEVALSNNQFIQKQALEKSRMSGEGKDDSEIEKHLKKEQSELEKNIRDVAKTHLKASLGSDYCESKDDLIKKITSSIQN